MPDCAWLVRPFRGSVLAAIVVLGAACSGAESSGPELLPSSSSIPGDVAPDESVVSSPPDEAPVVTTSDDAAEVRVGVDIAGSTFELSGELADSSDLFGQFVSCSGLRASFGSYSVLASAPVGEVRSVSVVTIDLVDEPGVHDAAIRVEYANAPAVDAAGTMTIADDWRSGTYVGFAQDGSEVAGDFECRSERTAAPLTIDPAAETLEAVEVFALIRSGDRQRIVGLAALASGSATIECPGAIDGSGDSDLVLRVVGDDSTGAVTAFEMTAGDGAALRMTIGGVEYAFDEVERGASDLAGAGTFGAEADGIEVDGAFRCR